MEHNAYILKPEQGLISSLLKFFSMVDLCLINDIDKVEAIDIICIDCKKETILYLGKFTLKERISKFVLNVILHHVGLLCVIFSNKEIKYEIDEINHLDWLNKVPWYNIAIFSRLHGSFLKIL